VVQRRYARAHVGDALEVDIGEGHAFVLAHVEHQLPPGIDDERMTERLAPVLVAADLRRAAGHVRPRRPGGDDDLAYNPAQRLAYFAVVAVLFPAMIWTGLAMSPAVTAVVPFLVTVLGGQQSARTIHFAVACALVLFLAGHVAMVALSGFRVRMRGMITGRRAMSPGRA